MRRQMGFQKIVASGGNEGAVERPGRDTGHHVKMQVRINQPRFAQVVQGADLKSSFEPPTTEHQCCFHTVWP